VIRYLKEAWQQITKRLLNVHSENIGLQALLSIFKCMDQLYLSLLTKTLKSSNLNSGCHKKIDKDISIIPALPTWKRNIAKEKKKMEANKNLCRV